MNLLRTILIRFSYAILPILLFSFGLAWSLYMVFGTPDPAEQALKQSGIYATFAQNTLDEQTAGSNTAVPIQVPEVQAAVQKAFPPSLLEQNTNKIIDGTYDWVQGRSASPNFTVDLTEPKANLATYIADYVRTRTAALPACSYQESLALAQTGVSNIDPYTLTCRPAQVSADDVAEQAKQQVLSSDILANSVITADTIKNSEGKTLSQQLEIVPKAYSWMITGLFGAGVLAAGAILLLVLLQRKAWHRAVKRLSILLISVGALSAGMAWAIGFGFNKMSDILADGATSQMLQTKLVSVFNVLAHDLQKWWIGYGVVLVLLGIIGFVVRKLVKEQPQVLADPSPVNVQSPLTPSVPPTSPALPSEPLPGQKAPSQRIDIR